ncbi:SsrA-binding protein SmpB [Candidatus Saccharibacteria bacterium]|nr:SsrA-binding protein SmpB [Candidatus Saccharibacteria bacterium]
MAKKKSGKSNTPKTISNRRARHDYTIEDGLIVGIQLSGAETKALRHGHGQLRGAYVMVKDNELWLINATISPMPGIPISESDQTRSRKLLAKRKEIDKLLATKQQGRTIVPLEILTRGRYIKVRIAAGKGKKLYDKRETLKKRTTKLDIDRDIKSRI